MYTCAIYSHLGHFCQERNIMFPPKLGKNPTFPFAFWHLRMALQARMQSVDLRSLSLIGSWWTLKEFVTAWEIEIPCSHCCRWVGINGIALVVSADFAKQEKGEFYFSPMAFSFLFSSFLQWSRLLLKLLPFSIWGSRSLWLPYRNVWCKKRHKGLGRQGVSWQLMLMTDLPVILYLCYHLYSYFSARDKKTNLFYGSCMLFVNMGNIYLYDSIHAIDISAGVNTKYSCIKYPLKISKIN